MRTWWFPTGTVSSLRKKAHESMTAQYEAMNDWRAKGREAKAAEAQNQVGDRQVEAPAAAAETSAEMEAGN